MGLDMTDEHDEVTPLSEYARLALSRPEPDKENIMCVIDEACSSCVQINYEIPTFVADAWHVVVT